MVKAKGYDAIIVMQLIATRAQSTYVAANYNQGFQTNGIYYYPDYLDASSYATDMEYIVATNVWSLKNEKLLWSGITESTNSEKIDRIISYVSEEIVNKMRADKFIPEK